MRFLTAILFCMMSSISLQAQKIDYGNNKSNGQYFSIKGIRLYTEIYGKGEPLVLLHGNGGSIASMSPIIPYLSQKYQVIAVDSRSHGKSFDTKDSLSFELMADDISALLTQLKIKKAYYIGWSDGGIIAIMMAIHHPDQVLKIAATGANISPDASAFIPGAWEESKKYYDSTHSVIRKTRKEKNDWKLFLLDWLHPHISYEQLEKILSPTLIICGDHDVISLTHTIDIYQHIPHAQLWVVPNSSHGTLVEHPKTFCQTVETFLEAKN